MPTRKKQPESVHAWNLKCHTIKANPAVPGTAPEPAADPDSAGRALPAIPTWPGFEPESITGAQLSASLEPDYLGLDVPDWVIVKIGPLAAKGDVTVNEFRTVPGYVVEHVAEHVAEHVVGVRT